ncbi:MAG: histone deacetylase [Deltaproteobacteria bacterium]|nr:MAG: histone deacetylase [Deltaproteobacteria bacterium]
MLAAQKAIEGVWVFHLGGGWHHAFPDKAEGFCYLNDVAIAVRKLQKENAIKKISIIDCDLHQGNGTAYIFQDDTSVFTFSIHQQNLYPVKQKSTLDIGLSDWADDQEYLQGLSRGIQKALLEFQPEIVFYLAGADPFKEDQLGSLQVSMEGLLQRDKMVFQACKEIMANVVVVLAGGYAVNTADTVQIHFNTAQAFWEER